MMAAAHNRRSFLQRMGLLGMGLSLSPTLLGVERGYLREDLSDFAKKLLPEGRFLETEGYYVWCNSPIWGPDGKLHVFYSRWPEKYGMSGWIHQSEIAHAIADSPESGFETVQSVLKPRPGMFDATTCHNPSIHFVDGKYCLFYMGNSNGKTDTKRIGLAIADSLYGPWEKPEKPLLEPGPEGSWDDHCTTNHAFIKRPDGAYWLFYKSWNTQEYQEAKGKRIRANRKYGLATADRLTGPYQKKLNKPVIDFSKIEGNAQLEDAFVWQENGKIKMLARDMGFFNHNVGLYLESEDGINWSKPQIGYKALEDPPSPSTSTDTGGWKGLNC